MKYRSIVLSLALLLLAQPVVALEMSFFDVPRATLEAGETVTSAKDVEGGQLQEAQAILLIKARPAVVWETIVDYDSYNDFFAPILESQTLPAQIVDQIAANPPDDFYELEDVILGNRIEPRANWKPGDKSWTSLVYGIYEFPSPIDPRWYIIEATHDESQAAKGMYRMSWTLKVGDVKAYRGSWELTDFGDGSSTVVRYTGYIEPNGGVPDFYLTAPADDIAPSMIRSLRDRAYNAEATYIRRIEAMREKAAPAPVATPMPAAVSMPTASTAPAAVPASTTTP